MLLPSMPTCAHPVENHFGNSSSNVLITAGIRESRRARDRTTQPKTLTTVFEIHFVTCPRRTAPTVRPQTGSCSPTDSGCDDSSNKSKGPAPFGRCEDGSSRKLPPVMPPAGTRYQRCPANLWLCGGSLSTAKCYRLLQPLHCAAIRARTFFSSRSALQGVSLQLKRHTALK